jgi:hypothetical protein
VNQLLRAVRVTEPLPENLHRCLRTEATDTVRSSAVPNFNLVIRRHKRISIDHGFNCGDTREPYIFFINISTIIYY